jgi:hypothetical protein
MQPNHARTIGVIKVAADGVLNHRAQLLDRVCFCENCMPKGTRFETALRGLFDGKDYLGRRSLRPFCFHFCLARLVDSITA